jgi:hypothetical protein
MRHQTGEAGVEAHRERSPRPWRERLLNRLQLSASDPAVLRASTLSEFFAGFQWDEPVEAGGRRT